LRTIHHCVLNIHIIVEGFLTLANRVHEIIGLQIWQRKDVAVHSHTIAIVLVKVHGWCQATANIGGLITFAIDLLIVTVPSHVVITHPVEAFVSLHVEVT
jgi:hypothetical protein